MRTVEEDLRIGENNLEKIAGNQEFLEVLKSPLIHAQGATACAGRQQVPEVVHKILKNPFIDAQGSKERSAYERLFSGR